MPARPAGGPGTQRRQLSLPLAPVKGRVRADSLPEFTRYRDDGCDVHPSCLSCPLPRCRYEEPGGLRALLNETRDQEIMMLRAQGVAVGELADRFGVSRRTVFRVLGQNANHPIPIRTHQPAIEEERREAHCA
jgi:hypothetical protein